MTDQDIRSELKMLYISMETFSGIKMAFNDYANTLDAADSKRQAISSAFDSDDEDILPASGVGLMLTLKLFLLYVANGNGRVTAQQLSYIDKMVDDDILDASISAANLMAQVPSFNEGPLYPIKFLDVLIRNDSMSKYLHPENNQSGAIRCVRVFSELGRGVIALDENAVSTQRYREFIQNLRDLAIESGDGAYSEADFAFVAENINSITKRNSTQTTAPAKKATAPKKTTTSQKKTMQDEAEKTAKPTAAKKAEPAVELMTEDGYVLLGKGKRNIKEKEFANRLDLERVEIAHGIKKICVQAFEGCANLKSIRLPNTLKTIEIAAFEGCGLTELEIPNGVEDLGPDSSRKEYYDDAFRGMEELQTLSLPDSIERAGIFGILASEQFKCLTMSRAVAEKLSDDRYMIKHREKIHLTDASDEERDIIVRAVKEDGTLRLREPTVIKNLAFYDRDDLVRIVIPEGVTEIRDDAFSYCKNLKEVVCPQSLVVIGSGAFEGCEKLAKIELPQNLRKLCTEAFEYCDSLHELVIPKSVEYMGEGIFGLSDDNIDKLTILGTPMIDSPDDLEYSGVRELRITQAFYNQHKGEKWLRERLNELVIIKPEEAFRISQARQSAPSAPVSIPRPAENPNFAPAAAKVADPNAERRKQLEAQIRSLEAERDAVRGLFGGIKRKKLQTQIDELQAELRRLS